ncbi:DUF1850 domain-containing protein [Oceanobacillus massiliensis]|uniref:DUF1850 domain-containing protein n=1 Tax=Oceanobacillus massiliensis TaxID=1465765 RepID=UPI0002D8142D|nr:DUF1850 domain-containing protein [Oceanobacillus massiliensis]
MKHRIGIAATVIMLLSLIGFTLLIPFRTALVFYEKSTDHIEAFLPISPGDTFQIIFTHSIHLTDVVEKYQIMDNHDIKQYEIVYEEFGIGMPSNALEGETFTYEDGKYHIKDLDNYFPSLKVRNGKTVSENRLVWKHSTSNKTTSAEEQMVRFNEYFEPGAWFTMKVEKLTLWEYLKGVKIHE